MALHKYIKEFAPIINRMLWYIPTAGIHIQGGAPKQMPEKYHNKIVSAFQMDFVPDVAKSYVTRFKSLMKNKNTLDVVHKEMNKIGGQRKKIDDVFHIILNSSPTSYLNHNGMNQPTADAIAKYYQLDTTQNDKYDLITCLSSLHQIDSVELDATLQELYDKMNTDGILIVKENDISSGGDLCAAFQSYSQMTSDTVPNCMTMEQWNKKIEKAGFRGNNSPYWFVIRDHPFNEFIRAYKKIDLNQLYPGVVGRSEKLQFFRILNAKAPRVKYGRINNNPCDNPQTNILADIEFLTIYYELMQESPIKTNADAHKILNEITGGVLEKTPYMIYAGSPLYVETLCRLFPEVHFVLHGGSPKIKSNANIHVVDRPFDIDIAKRWNSAKHSDKSIMFVVDKMMYGWYHAMQPQLSSFGFRLPWTDETTQFLVGDLYILPCDTTETRLIVYGPKAADATYDNLKYNEQMFYFNAEARYAQYHNPLEKIPMEQKPGLNDQYNAAAEIHILSNYIEAIGGQVNKNTICQLSKDISKGM